MMKVAMFGVALLATQTSSSTLSAFSSSTTQEMETAAAAQ